MDQSTYCAVTDVSSAGVMRMRRVHPHYEVSLTDQNIRTKHCDLSTRIATYSRLYTWVHVVMEDGLWAPWGIRPTHTYTLPLVANFSLKRLHSIGSTWFVTETIANHWRNWLLSHSLSRPETHHAILGLSMAAQNLLRSMESSKVKTRLHS